MFALCLSPRAALAQAYDAATADEQLDTLRKQITGIQTALRDDDTLDDTALSTLKANALAANAAAAKVAAALGPLLSSVQARLAELGKPIVGTKEPADVAAQRAQLDRDSTALDAEVKLARLLAVEADQASEQVSMVRRVQLQERLGERTPSILAAPFWRQLRTEFPQNTQRVVGLGGELRTSVRNTPIAVWAGVLVAILAVMLGHRWAGHYLLRLTSTRVPPGRLRRSVHATVLTLLAVATPALLAEILGLGILWNSVLSEKATTILSSAIGIICYGGFVVGLGSALLSPGHPSWRLLPLPDRFAHRMRRFPLVFAIVLVMVWVAQRVSTVVNAGLSTAVAVNCIVALVLVATLALGVLRAARVWRQIRQTDETQARTAPIWVRGAVMLLCLTLATSVISLLIGYVALGSFIAKQVSWVLVIICSTYLMMVLVDDLCMLLSSPVPDPDARNPVLPTRQARDQAAVLLSAGSRTIVIVLAILLLLAPFGEAPGELFHRAGQLRDGLVIGEIHIRPSAVIQALLVLLVGFFGVRMFKQWLEKRYLPTTNLDAGMQVSALTLFGYVGGIVAVATALSAAGIGLERIAWVASALSVGIGFGLQGVVQNFVSGLIMLAERPVKVGDWVSLGGVEGDIRRINVRATEIQMGDRSTVIVPNSEFITKTVRNVTHANPLGLVQIKLPLPLDTDADKARTLILATFADNTDIQDTPEPNVQLDGIDNGYLMFNATGFVSSPRLAYGVRSALLFELLKRLRKAEMPVSKPNTMLLGAAPLAAEVVPTIRTAG